MSDVDAVLEIPDDDDGVPERRPPAGFEPVRTWELASIEQLSALRGELTAVLAQAGHDAGPNLDDTASRLVLIASELATNALEHALPPTVVLLSRDDPAFLLEVTDQALRNIPVFAGGRDLGEGGIGMHLTRRLSDTVGWYRGETTKTVWATFPRTA
ncbi:ATP-binding protein [Luteimicrobium subarcticum]|uniref:Anti-sigma regulatory factor (Ser/Thr protein kinase) n=1 Tax=Luteimicrobium subarcticum TaxID=620910 RepID=A0A2M8WSK7_9MICO|nr:ATP-binding protein [Luteimicrobium subarcticum]PJI93910.1 anti-sigma regulatory factor (Ser/Thr protein kinase) [Luteimicrobium subarcticum]